MRLAIAALMLLFFSPSVSVGQAEMYDGHPTISENIAVGYFIWRDGERWHLRWMTKGRTKTFSGSVTAAGGELTSLKRIDVLAETRMIYPNRLYTVTVGPPRPGLPEVSSDRIDMKGKNRIVFHTETNETVNGFDFNVDDNVETLTFVLEIDKRPAPEVVQVGKDNQKPAAGPIVVKLK